MTAINEANDTTAYLQLERETAELRQIIQQIRAEANLPPMFKAKRQHSLATNVDDIEER